MTEKEWPGPRRGSNKPAITRKERAGPLTPCGRLELLGRLSVAFAIAEMDIGVLFRRRIERDADSPAEDAHEIEDGSIAD